MTPTRLEKSSEVSGPVFGEWFTGIHASDDNPHKHGRYVRTVWRPGGRMNGGTFYELTDGHGMFWLYPVDSIIRRAAADDECDEDGWREYDHGFRDGYQAARRELKASDEELLKLVRGAVELWDEAHETDNAIALGAAFVGLRKALEEAR